MFTLRKKISGFSVCNVEVYYANLSSSIPGKDYCHHPRSSVDVMKCSMHGPRHTHIFCAWGCVSDQTLSYKNNVFTRFRSDLHVLCTNRALKFQSGSGFETMSHNRTTSLFTSSSAYLSLRILSARFVFLKSSSVNCRDSYSVCQ